MKRLNTAVFDVDGTLLDTTEGVLSSVAYTIEKYHLMPLNGQQLKSFIGPPIQDSFEKYYGIQGSKLQELAECFREHYKKYDLLKATPYPGIFDTLQQLKSAGIKLAIATYKRQDYATRLLEHFSFNQYTSVIYGADNYNKLKKKDIIIQCMQELGIDDYSSAVMIGDSDNDAIGAKNIGMNFLGVTYGFGFCSKEDVARYPSIGYAATPTELIQYFL